MTADNRARYLEQYENLYAPAQKLRFPATKPHFDDLLLDTDGTVWLRVRTSDEGEQRDVYKGSDRMGIVTLKPRLLLTGVSANALYVVARDDDDVEALLRIPVKRRR